MPGLAGHRAQHSEGSLGRKSGDRNSLTGIGLEWASAFELRSRFPHPLHGAAFIQTMDSGPSETRRWRRSVGALAALVGVVAPEIAVPGA